MQSYQSPFLVNIVPLGNTQTNITGDDATTSLSNSVAKLQEMVNYDQKRIYTDYLGSYTTGGTIEVLSPLNLSNVGLTSNGVPIGTGTGTGIDTATIGTTNTFINFFNTTSINQTAMSFNVGNRQVFGIRANGNGLFYDPSNLATEFRISSIILRGDAASFSTINVDGRGSFGGIVYAQNFITLSDMHAKQNISEYMVDICGALKNVRTYSYSYQHNKERDIGLLAQELEDIFPECIEGRDGYKYVKYNAVVALLVSAVRQLGARVESLELESSRENRSS